MSRIAKNPIPLIAGVKISIDDRTVTVEGKNGQLSMQLHDSVTIAQSEDQLTVAPKIQDRPSWAMAGTMRSLVNNMLIGVSQGYEKKLKLIGVGYRAAIQGNRLNLTLGFSHPIDFEIPEGIKVDAPSQTDLVISGADKQLVGEVAAKIRAFRPPEPYKGKGVRYADEQIKLKEAKKK
ncbi:50S ribosomal protein L6 [Ostreibacterium oceani]|uniref:Large ribosomal subunit protein uL6 n=1 Tax=Ostreibacterium oceani TaxID=2654998 RepID=A0A6N7EVZ0_9GAMM|nr:50S ribosomal protein L6 [Ostreibacterium oceani]MPV85755.1 50S ribosomal protein L6 [Ostreibacterium oceani]